jgi:hypothetical protein
MSRPTIPEQQDAPGLTPAYVYTDTIQHHNKHLYLSDRLGTVFPEIYQQQPLMYHAIKVLLP